MTRASAADRPTLTLPIFTIILTLVVSRTHAQQASDSSSSTALDALLSSSSSVTPYDPVLDDSSWYGIERHEWAQAVGGVFACLACLVSGFHITAHLKHNHQSQLRRYVIRMLGLVPFYAILAWLGLMMPRYTLYFDVARDFYESMVIFSFFQFCLYYLGGAAILNESLAHRPPIPHSWPVNKCLGSHWNMSHRFLFHTRFGVMQYVILKFSMAVITFICAANDVYGDGEWSFSTPYTYATIINNLSQCWALYCLLLFYYATRDDLEGIRPMAKFLCIKLIVFATYWQSIIISIAALAEKIPTTKDYSAASVSAGLQDFLICIEMLFASIGHIIAFPSHEFSNSDGSSDDSALQDNAFSKILQVITPKDIVDNIHELNRLQDKYQRVKSVEMSEKHFRRGRRKHRESDGVLEDEAEIGHTYTLDGIEDRLARVKDEVKARARQQSASSPIRNDNGASIMDDSDDEGVGHVPDALEDSQSYEGDELKVDIHSLHRDSSNDSLAADSSPSVSPASNDDTMSGIHTSLMRLSDSERQQRTREQKSRGRSDADAL